MTQRAEKLTTIEQVFQGALLGVLAGLVAAGLEYLLLMEAFSVNQARAYWKILIPYALLGLVGGLLVAVAVRVLRGATGPASRSAASIAAWLIALMAFAYVAAWATARLGLAEIRLANVAAVVGAAVGAALLGLGLQRLLTASFGWLERRVGTRVSFRLALPAALAVLAGLVLVVPGAYLAGAQPGQPAAVAPAARQDRPNVLFILIDALRADHLPPYGYSRQTAPNLTALAREGMVFTQAYASASYTRASVATLLSSLYPSVHRANDGQDFLPSSVRVLPELLRAAGYTTYGISSNANVSPTFGYSRGFDEFRVWKTESEFRLTMAGKTAEYLLGSSRLSRLLGEPSDIVPTADAITDATLGWVNRAARQPYFMYVHYIDPHDPYRPPAPYDRAFDHRTDPPRRGTVEALSLAPAGADREALGRTLDQYDGEILHADHHVGRLLQGLEQRGLLDNTLILVTADHGEEFLDHGNEIHGRSAYEEVIRVPFIVHWRKVVRPGTRVDGMVGLIDVMPTLLELAGAPAPPGIQGQSFAALLRDPAAAWPDRTFLAQVINKQFTIEAIRDGRHKYIRHVRGPETGREELYDLQADPLERTNLVGEARARTAALRKALDTFNEVLSRYAANVPAEQAAKLDQDTERALRSLGYIK